MFEPAPEVVKEKRRQMRKEEAIQIDLLSRAVPAKQTDEGIRTLSKDKPINPESVQRYLEKKFGDALDDAYGAMRDLAKSMDPSRLAEAAYDLYEKFRPDIPEGKKGWGAEGTLSLHEIRKMAE